MALTPSNLEDAFIREVDEGVRQEQIRSLWQRYGIMIVAAVVLLLGSFAGFLWWQAEQKKAAGVAGEEFSQAIDKLGVGDNAAARPVFERMAKEGPKGYKALAQLMQAADAVAVGEEDKAAKMLEALAADSAQSQPLRDAALVKAVRLRYDKLAPADVIARLKPLAVPGNPWFGIAAEMTALAYLKAGEAEQAKPLLIAIVRERENASSLRNRAAQLALSLGVDEAALEPEKTPAEAADSATETKAAGDAAAVK